MADFQLKSTKLGRTKSFALLGSHSSMAAIDPKSGYCSSTGTFHSLRPQASLPPETKPLSVADFVFSRLAAAPPPPSAAALLDAATGRRVFYSELPRRVETLAASLRLRFGLSAAGETTAFVLSPNSVQIPILYYALLSLGVAISPANPAGSASEISRQIELCKPAVAFAASDSAGKIPALKHGVVLLDSPEFESMMTRPSHEVAELGRAVVKVRQSDTATILYSSGTTGRVKGVALTHRNWISVLIGAVSVRNTATSASPSPTVWLSPVPHFHVYGFGLCLRTLAMGDTWAILGSTGRFDIRRMVAAIEELRISHVAVAPPVVVAIAKDPSLTDGRDLSSLELVASGGAPLRRSVIEQLKDRLPNVQLAQAYGLTESTGRVVATVGLEESRVVGATGKLISNCAAKIVDPQTGTALPPMMPGELWIRGPCVMKGYVGDKEATDGTLDSDGWLRTGDLCYIDNEGFLFVIDRLKELIKYKAYQVAPAELEHLLQSHPAISDAAVVPYPDEEAGQVPMAFVVKRPGSIANELQIMEFVTKEVAPYKKIRTLRFIDAIPKSAQGKVLRRELIKLALQNPTSKL